MCIIENERYSNSFAKGSIKNMYGDNWQQVADYLSTLGKSYGSIIKIELSASTVNNGYLDFVIKFDHVQSGKKFCNGASGLNGLVQSMVFCDITYAETPRPKH
ncbi:unnamed protein product [Rotaria sordida]|uniref:Uncharacterized protein n=1 Tax=Rotaria sordida TaxID=392033 RepID=A0A813VLY7_9BILA|nr:unnamed protein product [Rotaria sordida]CAF4009577.1 unnamed protein product [Rotaria sordida]